VAIGAVVGSIIIGAGITVGASTDAPTDDPTAAPEVEDTTAEDATAEATGLTWPDEPVFLDRGEGFAGTFEVVNPTRDDTISVPKFADGGCEQQPLDEGTTVVAPAGLPTPVDISVPLTCTELDTGDLTLTAAATSGDKYDVAAITVTGEVDWAGLWGPALLNGIAMLVIALWVGLAACQRIGVSFWSAMAVDASAPASALTSITAIGSLVGAVVATPGLLSGLTGSDASPQLSFTVAGAAVSAVLVGAAAIIANLPLRAVAVDGERQVGVTVAQFALAAAITATGAVVILWTFATAVERLDLSVPSDAFVVFKILGMAVVWLYLGATVHRYIDLFGVRPEGPTEPTAPAAPSAEVVASLAVSLAPAYLPPGGRPSDAELGNWIGRAETAASKIGEGQPAPRREVVAGGLGRNLI
jgi:hypothetical protein